MALTGLDIYKHLPKENCKECGLATCLAFAMKVAGGQAALDECPRLSDEAKTELGEASAPPQQLVTIGAGDKAIELGQETVLFRHEERFHHPTALAIRVSDELDDAAIEARCQEVAALKFERVGTTSVVDMIAVCNDSGNAERFTAAAKQAAKAGGKPLALIGAQVDALRAAGKALAEERPLLWVQNATGQIDGAIEMAKELKLPMCLEAPGFEALAELTGKARDAGLKELVLSPGQVDPAAGLEFLTQSRRAAITKKFRPMGFPVAMTAVDDNGDQATATACWYVLKYAGIVVIDTTAPHQVLSILTTRQDIYTNPQVPVQVEPGLHVLGDPGADAPVLVTTNFALSYYSIESEVESSRMPAYILAVDTEGTSVLTAWAADKFTGESISETLAKSGVEQKVSHKKVIIPGLVAVLSASVEDESGWSVQVGPKEASGLVSFLKTQWKP